MTGITPGIGAVHSRSWALSSLIERGPVVDLFSAGGFMEKILMILTITFFSAVITEAQSELIPNNLPLTRLQPYQLIAPQVEPPPERSTRALPDAPIPVLPNLQRGPLPCPDGEGRSCALLGGRRYLPDLFHMTEHDRSWTDAMKNRGILFAVSMNVAAAVWDYKTTRHCIDVHRGREANPLMGQSRAQQLSVGIGLSAFTYFAAARLKKQGDGNYAFGALWVGTMMHFLAGTHSWSACHG
jgi:hypothetical protein